MNDLYAASVMLQAIAPFVILGGITVIMLHMFGG